MNNNFNIPKWIVLQLLESCNLRCKMCYEWGEKGAYHKNNDIAILDYSVVEKVVKDCLPCKPHFEFFGGEPLLYPEIGKLIELIGNEGCSIDLPTNGTLIEKYSEMLVDTKNSCLWISLDGPEEINDEQRGVGVFKKVIKNIEHIYKLRKTKGKAYPKIGITYVVTPLNHRYIEEFFIKSINLNKIDKLSIEFQSYITNKQYKSCLNILKNRFGLTSTLYLKGFIRDSSEWSDMDFEKIRYQMDQVKKQCIKKGIHFNSYPRTIEYNNIKNYFNTCWHKMIDKPIRCIFPWMLVEITARGNVSPCHYFYDLSLGNIYETDILDIWRGNRLKQVRSYLRKQLFPICPACCRYYHDQNYDK